MNTLAQPALTIVLADDSEIALRMQRVILRKAFLKLAPNLRCILPHTASSEAEWRVLGYEF